MKYLINGEATELTVADSVEVSQLSDRLIVRTPNGSATALAVRQGDTTYVSYRGRTYKIEKASRHRQSASGESNGECRAPMPGQIVEVLLSVNDTVATGDRILILEAMKMQQAIVAPHNGTITSISAQQGDQVDEGQLLAVVQQESEA